MSFFLKTNIFASLPKALEATEKDWMTSMSINVAGAGYMMSAVVPRMKNAAMNRKSI